MPIHGKVDLNKAREIINKDLRGVYLGGLARIIEQTPADNGRARNNWFFSTNKPSSSDGRGGDKSGSGSKSDVQSGMPSYVLGSKLFLTNNLPYINTLEYGGYPDPVQLGSYDKESKSYVKLSQGGFSLQRPGGWVRKTIKAMQRKIASL